MRKIILLAAGLIFLAFFTYAQKETNEEHAKNDKEQFFLEPWYIAKNGIYYNDGNVGIGTKNPERKLDVNGDINLTGDLYKNGDLLSLSLPWSQSDENIYFTTGNVAIGDLPDNKYKLKVNGKGYFKEQLYVGMPNGIEGLNILVGNFNNSGTPDIIIEDDYSDTGIEMGGFNFYIKTDGNKHLTVTDVGKVGIGTDAPLEKLEVNGNLLISGNRNIFLNSQSGYIEFNAPSGGWTMGPKYTGYEGTGHGGWRAYGSGDILNYYFVGSDYINPLFTVKPNGNVGIGTKSPSANLDIVSTTAPVLKLRTTGDGETYTAKFEITGASRGNIGEINFLFGGRRGDNIPDASIVAYNHSAENVADLVFYTSQGTGLLSQKMVITAHGNVGIGTTNPGSYKLAVEGKIGAHEVVVTTDGWADFVFEDNYELMSLADLKAFIKTNKHLPEIPTAEEVEENGISVGEMNAKLLQKIEELTLYTIQQQEVIETLKSQMDTQNKRIQQLENNNLTK